MTAVSSSRWAGAITRAVEDQYQLGMRGLVAHIADLQAAVGVLEARCALRPGELEPVDDQAAGRRRRRGYRSAAERFAKTRRLAVLRERLAAAQCAIAKGRPSIAAGGKRLWRTRNHLDAADMTEQQWRERWEARRLFLTADGESGKRGGNETIRVTDDGRLRIKTPAALADQFGSHVVIDAPIRFGHRSQEWADRVARRQAVRYDISYDPERGRWYLDASWKTTPEPVPALAALRSGRVLGVDLNAGHLACCVLDASGNPVGEPASIEVITAGLAASRRDGRVRAAITALLDHAQQQQCRAVVIEKLDFADVRASGRETWAAENGVNGCAASWLVSRPPIPGSPDRHGGPPRRGGDRRGCRLHQQVGQSALDHTVQQQAFDPVTVTAHHGAAVAIGRRGLGLAIRRRPEGPRTRQRTSVGTPPARPDPHPSHGGRHGSSGPPTRPKRGVPVHRKTPAASGQDRSGRTGLTPAH